MHDYYLYFSRYSIPSDNEIDSVEALLKARAISVAAADRILFEPKIKEILVPRALHEIVSTIDVTNVLNISNEICARFFRSSITPQVISTTFENVAAIIPVTDQDIAGFRVDDRSLMKAMSGDGVGKIVRQLCESGSFQGAVFGKVQPDFLHMIKKAYEDVELWARLIEVSRPEIVYHFELETDAIIVSAMYDDMAREWEEGRATARANLGLGSSAMQNQPVKPTYQQLQQRQQQLAQKSQIP